MHREEFPRNSEKHKYSLALNNILPVLCLTMLVTMVCRNQMTNGVVKTVQKKVRDTVDMHYK